MPMNVIKRDDSIQAFKFDKIENAIYKAFKSTTSIFAEFEKLSIEKDSAINKDAINQELADLTVKINEFTTEVNKFVDYIKTVFDKINKESIKVEEIQDIIQKELIKKNKYDVVEAFIIYRNKRAEARMEKTKLIKDVNKALNASDIQNQNANVDEASFGGRIGEAGRVVCKDRALKHMSKMARKNHEDGWIYIHKQKIVA